MKNSLRYTCISVYRTKTQPQYYITTETVREL